MSTPLIEIQGMTKVYGMDEATVHALAGVDITVDKGEFIAIMGHSGSGKSTLMNILGCLDRPTSGTYIFDGRDVSRLSRNELAEVRNQKLGFIFQSFNLLPRLSALANVMLPMLYNMEEDISDDETERRAIASLQAVGLGDRLQGGDRSFFCLFIADIFFHVVKHGQHDVRQCTQARKQVERLKDKTKLLIADFGKFVPVQAADITPIENIGPRGWAI